MTGFRLEHSYAELPPLFFSRQNPTPVRAPRIVVLNEPLALRLGLDATRLRSKEGAELLSGNNIQREAMPIAQAYAGHQFGHFTLLGDGRAILIGEQVTPDGKRFDIQLKGAGRTPYSRGGDGRAALGPMLREYVISEAMHALGIPTTRSLAVVSTGETVQREAPLAGAILVRVAESHLRVGTFQYASHFGRAPRPCSPRRVCRAATLPTPSRARGPLPALLARGHCSPSGPHSAMAGNWLCAWGHEYRQHFDQWRNH